MKKLLIILGLLLVVVSCNKDVITSNSKASGNTFKYIINADGGIKVGKDDAAATISEINIFKEEFYFLDDGGDTIPVRILSSQRIDGDTVYPNISSGEGAPSSTPSKVGDLYFDTSGEKVYGATGTSSSSDWKILN
jgi:hypothetical protein